MQEILQLQLQQVHYREIQKTYHFEEKDGRNLSKLGRTILQEIMPKLYYGAFPFEEKEGQEQIAVIVTLGERFDEIQEEYSRQKQLSESYQIECIGMELLKLAYEKVAEQIYEATGKWLGTFQFLGDKYPLEMIPAVCEALAPGEISYNDAYMLQPKKTVVFLSVLGTERKESSCHLCDNCSNVTCQNRQTTNLTYGYQRIFGKNRRRC